MPQTEVSIFRNTRDAIGDAPLWDAEARCLWWIDVIGRRLHRAEPASDATETFALQRPPGALALAGDGALVVAAGMVWSRFDPDAGTVEPIARIAPASGAVRFNGGVTDARGRFWTGTVEEARAPVGQLLCLDGRSVRSAANGFRTQNGCAISPDGRTFYVADSHPAVRTIWAYDFDQERGALANRRAFHQPQRGRPDGAAIDADGCYWYAALDRGRVVQLDPRGREMRAIALPVSRPTKPAFGGPDLSVLYVTSRRAGVEPHREPLAGAVFALDCGARGHPLPPVALSPSGAAAADLW